MKRSILGVLLCSALASYALAKTHSLNVNVNEGTIIVKNDSKKATLIEKFEEDIIDTKYRNTDDVFIGKEHTLPHLLEMAVPRIERFDREHIVASGKCVYRIDTNNSMSIDISLGSSNAVEWSDRVTMQGHRLKGTFLAKHRIVRLNESFDQMLISIGHETDNDPIAEISIYTPRPYTEDHEILHSDKTEPLKMPIIRDVSFVSSGVTATTENRKSIPEYGNINIISQYGTCTS